MSNCTCRGCRHRCTLDRCRRASREAVRSFSRSSDRGQRMSLASVLLEKSANSIGIAHGLWSSGGKAGSFEGCPRCRSAARFLKVLEAARLVFRAKKSSVNCYTASAATGPGPIIPSGAGAGRLGLLSLVLGRGRLWAHFQPDGLSPIRRTQFAVFKGRLLGGLSVKGSWDRYTQPPISI
jgi:hypothetical protein